MLQDPLFASDPFLIDLQLRALVLDSAALWLRRYFLDRVFRRPWRAHLSARYSARDLYVAGSFVHSTPFPFFILLTLSDAYKALGNHFVFRAEDQPENSQPLFFVM